MKKWIAFVLAMLMMGTALGESLDLSALSDNELQDLKSRIVAELEARHPTDTVLDFVPGEQAVLVNQDGLKIYLTGKWRDESFGKDLYLDIALENDSDKTVRIYGTDCSLNGWNLRLPVIIPAVDPGEKEANILSISYDDAMLESYKDMEKLLITLQAKPEEGVPVNYGPLEIHFNFQGE